MNVLKKLLFWLLIIIFAFIALWLLITTHDQAVTLNLIFADVGPINLGLVIVMTFLLGLVLGLATGASWVKVTHWKQRRQQPPAPVITSVYDDKSGNPGGPY